MEKKRVEKNGLRWKIENGKKSYKMRRRPFSRKKQFTLGKKSGKMTLPL